MVFDLGNSLRQVHTVGSSPPGGGIVASAGGVTAIGGGVVVVGGNVGASGGARGGAAGAGLIEFGGDVADACFAGSGAGLVDEREKRRDQRTGRAGASVALRLAVDDQQIWRRIPIGVGGKVGNATSGD